MISKKDIKYVDCLYDEPQTNSIIPERVSFEHANVSVVLLKLIGKLRQELKAKVKLTFMRCGITDKRIIKLLVEHREYVLKAIDDYLSVEGEKK